MWFRPVRTRGRREGGLAQVDETRRARAAVGARAGQAEAASHRLVDDGGPFERGRGTPIRKAVAARPDQPGHPWAPTCGVGKVSPRDFNPLASAFSPPGKTQGR